MAETEPGGIAGAVLAFEQAAVAAAAAGVREAGARTAEEARELVAALDAASAAAGDLMCGPALAGCADLLARRARDAQARADDTAAGMERAVRFLVDVDEEVSASVADAAG